MQSTARAVPGFVGLVWLNQLAVRSAPVGCKPPGGIKVVEGGGVARRVRVWDITNQEGNRLLRIVRRSAGSVVLVG
jgi:hypothetical protein